MLVCAAWNASAEPQTSNEKAVCIRRSVCLSVKRVHYNTRNSSGDEIANVNFL